MPTAPVPSPDADANQPLRSIHTHTFVQVLEQLGISLVVSTYQAGKVILLRADSAAVNTHFRAFQKPMGIAANCDRIALGSGSTIWELHNIPTVAASLASPHHHDACYIPRNIHVTGDIDIHEMAWAQDELWFVNTRFSCLCTLDKPFSFVPRWRPPFITAYDLRDRCHLNGLGLRDHQPRYVTALGETDSPGGWRSNKASGGILMDIQTNQVLLRGLSMPHSPRWYQERLWVLESGQGSLSYWEPNRPELVPVAHLPGFTRGLDFYGNFAFIGLSQIRESAVFSGLPLTQTLSERICGVWIVDVRTGETVGFLKFEDAVQEIFAVAVLPGVRFPELVEWSPELMGGSYVLPDEALANTVTPAQDWECAETYFTQGNQHYGQHQLEAAIAAYRKCLALQPSYLPARYNLGVTLGDLGQYDEAVDVLNQVIAAEARHAEACNSLGFVYTQQLQLANAIAAYRQAILIRPDFATAHYNLALTLLQTGHFAEGWAEYEWRWQTPQFTPFPAPHPQWDGHPIPDQTLLIHTEQGPEDAIQFIRYVPLVAHQCSQVILVCAAELVPLFQGMTGIIEIRTAGEIALNAFDVYIPLMSLPHLLQTQLTTIPAACPYLSVPTDIRDSVGLEHPQTAPQSALQVGIAWTSNKPQDSIALDDWRPVLQVPNHQFLSLQTGQSVPGLEPFPIEIQQQFPGDVGPSYGALAAVIQTLDLVITVDAPVAHLAGALGKPVWLLLSDRPHWRWLLDREDCPWYPTLELFRQTQPGDWAPVLARVAQRLKAQPLSVQQR